MAGALPSESLLTRGEEETFDRGSGWVRRPCRYGGNEGRGEMNHSRGRLRHTHFWRRLSWGLGHTSFFGGARRGAVPLLIEVCGGYFVEGEPKVRRAAMRSWSDMGSPPVSGRVSMVQLLTLTGQGPPTRIWSMRSR